MIDRGIRKPLWREAWRPALLGLAVAQGCWLLGVERDRLGEAHAIEQWLARSADPATRIAYNPARDRKPGQRLPALAVRDVAGRSAAAPPPLRGADSVVVFVGECAPCAVPVLRAWQQAVNGRLRVYVVTGGDPEQVQEFRQRYKLALPFLLDRVGNSHGSHDVAWRPRAYLLDGHRRLLYAQPRWENSEMARNKVIALARRSAGNFAPVGPLPVGGTP